MQKSNKTLAGKITINLFVLSTIILLIVVGFLIVVIHSKLQEDFDLKISAFLFSKTKFLSEPLYKNQLDVIENEVNSFNIQSDMLFKEITVYNENNELLSSITKQGIYRDYDSDITIRRDIYHTNNEGFVKVGTIEVVIDNKEIEEFIKSLIVQIILVGAVLLLILNYIIYKVLEHHISPIKRLSRKMLDIERNPKIKIEDLDVKTIEIKNLYQAFNIIKGHYENYQERLEGEVFDRTMELEDYKNHLESMVQEQVEDINKAKLEAERANIAKSEFLANMSHEFRTPMHAIISYSKMGLDKGKDINAEKALKYFGNINMSGERLLELLNDLLDLSKLESGLVSIKKQRNNIEAAIDQVIAETKSLSEEKHIKIIKNINLEDIYENFDSPKIIQVLVNLFSNAIKFNKPGGEIICTIKDIEIDSKIFLQVSVEDEGTGIPDEELKKVFDKFFQSSKTRTGAGGTGLGLSICRLIIESHEGKIWAKNREDCGSEFTFILPRN